MTPHSGQCYPVAEALYHALGGRAAGWAPQVLRLPNGSTHWYLRHKSGFILDPTATQFVDLPYEKGRGCGFLTKQPSKRAAKYLKDWNG